MNNLIPTINLCSEYFACEGRELNIYFDNVIETAYPLSMYEIEVTCSKGAQYEKFFRYTAISADAGTQSLTLAVKFNNVTVATKTTTINIVALTSGNAVTRKLLVIGDSTTSGGVTTGEINTLFTGDVMTCTLIGTKGSAANIHEGVSGKTFAYFRTDVASPFVFSGSFNFSTYLSTNGFTMGSNDWVFFNLGINDIFSQTTDAGVDATIVTIKTDLDAMIANIKSAVSGVRVGVCITIPPAPTQDAFGDDYQNGQNRKRYARGRHCLAKELIAYYDTAGQKTAKTFVIPIDASIDTVNNFNTASTQVNARNVATFTMYNNGVHPNAFGYYQTADVYFSFLKTKI